MIRPWCSSQILFDDLVEEIAVVADDDHRDRLARQVAFEPFGRRDIEMVGRLVQEHQVGAFQQELGQHHPRLLAAGKRGRRAVELGLGEAEARQHLLDPVIDRIGILVLDLAVELVVPPPGPFAVRRVFGLGHLGGGFLELVLQIDQRREPRLDDLHQRLAGLEAEFLAQQADPDSRAGRRAGRNRADPAAPGAGSAWSCRRRWARPGRSARRREPRKPAR